MIGLVTGTGLGELPGLEVGERRRVETAEGAVDVRVGRLGGRPVAHLPRHGAGHARLSSHVAHRANAAALRELGVRAVLGTTVCGSVDPAVAPGTLVVFDDLYFPSNRLPDGSLCTRFAPGEPGRGHWIFDRPFSEGLRRVLVEAAHGTGLPVRVGGCYGHVDGPRFNSWTEIRALAAAGVTAVSQTAGPEAVLCGEAELPYALAGFVTDWANGVAEEPTSAEELARLLAEGADALARLARDAVVRLGDEPVEPAGFVYRLGD